MKPDLYTKVVLTAIAIFHGVICRYLVQRYGNDDAIANPQSIVGRAKCDDGVSSS